MKILPEVWGNKRKRNYSWILTYQLFIVVSFQIPYVYSTTLIPYKQFTLKIENDITVRVGLQPFSIYITNEVDNL
jgi:hypothetical protein